MLFSSLLFLWLFLPLVAGVYYLLPKAWRRAKNGLLLVASLFFYGWGEPVLSGRMVASIAVNYGVGLMRVEVLRRGKAGAGGFSRCCSILRCSFFQVFRFCDRIALPPDWGRRVAVAQH